MDRFDELMIYVSSLIMFPHQVYKQKMKHLLCEHQNTLSELKAYGSDSTEVLQTEQEQLEMELYKKMKALMIDMQELDNENLVRELELVCRTHFVFILCFHLHSSKLISCFSSKHATYRCLIRTHWWHIRDFLNNSFL